MPLQLRLELLEQGERIRYAAREAGQDLPVHHRSDFLGLRFHDGVVHRHLAIATDGHLPVPSDADDGGPTEYGFGLHDRMAIGFGARG